jgi:riboflavin synthase
MNLKSSYIISSMIGDKEFTLICENDASLGSIYDFLNETRSFIIDRIVKEDERRMSVKEGEKDIAEASVASVE